MLRSYAFLDQAPAQRVSIVDGDEQTLSILGSLLKIGPCITKDSQQDFDEIQDRIFDAFFTTKGQVREPDFACGQHTTLSGTSLVVTLARNQMLAATTFTARSPAGHSERNLARDILMPH